MVLWSLRTLIWNRGYFSCPLSPSECADGLNSILSEHLLAFQVKDVSMQSCCFQRLSWFRCEALNASICVYMLHHSGSVSELQGIKSPPIWIHSTNIYMLFLHSNMLLLGLALCLKIHSGVSPAHMVVCCLLAVCVYLIGIWVGLEAHHMAIMYEPMPRWIIDGLNQYANGCKLGNV